MVKKGSFGLRATLVYQNKMKFPDGNIMEAAIWLVPQEVPGSKHNLKYSLFYGHKDDAGLRTVGYDNEQPKGDHRHYGDREVPYVFTTPEQLVIDFLQDVAKVRGKRPVSPTAPVTKEGENV